MATPYVINFCRGPETLKPCERLVVRTDSYRMFEPYELVLLRWPASERIAPARYNRPRSIWARLWQWFRYWVLRRPGPSPFCGLVVENIYIGQQPCLMRDAPAEMFGMGTPLLLPVVLEGDDVLISLRNDSDHDITIHAQMVGRLIENVVHLPRANA
jgi:hypothetical protein